MSKFIFDMIFSNARDRWSKLNYADLVEEDEEGEEDANDAEEIGAGSSDEDKTSEEKTVAEAKVSRNL